VSDPPVPLKHAGRGRPDPRGGVSGPEHARLAFPPAGTLLWTPRRPGHGAPAPSADGPYELAIERETLAAVLDHVAGDRRESRFGFLLGRLFRCPDTGVHYAVVDRAIPAKEAFSEEAPGAYLLRAWAEAQRELWRHPGVLLGWYHSHRLLGLLLSEGDLDVNRRYFGEPWQCCLLLVPDEARPLGAVFRPGLQEQDGPPGREPTRFWELPGAGRAAGRPSPLDWTNYERADRAASGARGAGPGPGAGVAVETSASTAGEGATRAVPLVIPEDTEEVLPVPPQGRRPKWTTVAGVLVGFLVLAALAVLALVPAPEPSSPSAGVAGPSRPPVSAELARFRGAASDLRAAVDRYEERARDFDAGRIGCDLLTTGYGSVDQAFIRIASARGDLDSQAAAAVSEEFTGLSTEVDDVNRHFDSTRCPRPQ